MPPQVNAQLLAVSGADPESGGKDDWDNPVDPTDPPSGTSKWAGSADAYYSESIRRVSNGDTVDLVQVRALIIDTHIARDIGIDTDDVLTFTDPAGVERRARAAVIRRSQLAGIPAQLQTTRLELELR